MEDRLSNILDGLNVEDTTVLLEEDINLSINSFSKRRIMKSVKKKVKNKGKNHNFMNEFLGGFFMKRKLILSGVMLCSMVIIGGGGYAYANTPVAYVSLDINPSVELGVNRLDQVVSAEGYNEDGKNILENTDLKNDNVNEAVGTLIENAIDKGYITSDNEAVISLTTATDNATISEELEDSLKVAADEVLDKNEIQAEIAEDNIALQRRDEARKLGITPGKLNLIQKLQALDSNIKVEDYKNLSVKEIQKKNKELRKVTNEENSDKINDDLNNNYENNISDEEIENKIQREDSTNYLEKENVLRQEKKNSDNNSNNNKDKEFNQNKPEKQEENNSSNSKNDNLNKAEQKENNNSSLNSQSKNSNKK
ncbi:hypothetical protein [Clostridium sp. ZBS2]|uniref:anti-sigma-I factor RsgI family protein n=1 Tax=Clostridium sp. ZBS2 TaxID=2949976 RepID=UPI00207AD825|nr:hypothetical protein [Clostridium sp. ZBS2]